MNPTSDFSFIDFRIHRLNFSLNEKFNTNKGEAKVQTEFKIRHESRQNRLKVYLSINFDDKTAPFTILLEGVGLFELNREFSEPELDALSNNHCSTVIFPYLREAVADITRRAGFPPLHIPQVDFSRVFNKQTADTQAHTLH